MRRSTGAGPAVVQIGANASRRVAVVTANSTLVDEYYAVCSFIVWVVVKVRVCIAFAFEGADIVGADSSVVIAVVRFRSRIYFL